MLYLTRLFITTNDSSSWMVSRLTAYFKGETLSQSHRTQLIRCKRTTPSYLRSLTCEIHLLGKHCSHDMVVADVVHPILGMDFFQDGEGKRCIIEPRRRCLADRYTTEEFPMDNKTVLGFFADFCNSCAKSLSLRIQGTEQHKQHG